jgi:hypothetical protein
LPAEGDVSLVVETGIAEDEDAILYIPGTSQWQRSLERRRKKKKKLKARADVPW